MVNRSSSSFISLQLSARRGGLKRCSTPYIEWVIFLSLYYSIYMNIWKTCLSWYHLLMSEAITVAEKYFALSNQHDMDAIAELLTDSSTRSSVRTGVYLGREQIMDMMRPFHESFSELRWDIETIEEIRPGVVEVRCEMTGIKLDGTAVSLKDLEYVIVKDGKLQHVEVREG